MKMRKDLLSLGCILVNYSALFCVSNAKMWPLRFAVILQCSQSIVKDRPTAKYMWRHLVNRMYTRSIAPLHYYKHKYCQRAAFIGWAAAWWVTDATNAFNPMRHKQWVYLTAQATGLWGSIRLTRYSAFSCISRFILLSRILIRMWKG